MCEDDAKCNLLLDRAPKCLKKIIIFKEVRPATKQRAVNRGVEIVKFSDVETMGSKQKYPEEVRIFHIPFVLGLSNSLLKYKALSCLFPSGLRIRCCILCNVGNLLSGALKS